MPKLRELKMDNYEPADETRENFEAVRDYIDDNEFTNTDWKLGSIEISGVYTTSNPFKFKHGNSVIPTEVWIVSDMTRSGQSTKGSIAIDYDNITKDVIPFTCDNAAGAKVRFFYGKYGF